MKEIDVSVQQKKKQKKKTHRSNAQLLLALSQSAPTLFLYIKQKYTFELIAIIIIHVPFLNKFVVCVYFAVLKFLCYLAMKLNYKCPYLPGHINVSGFNLATASNDFNIFNGGHSNILPERNGNGECTYEL